MITRVLNFVKPFIIVFLLIALLQFTGLWSSTTAAAQLLILKTGLLDIDAEEVKSPAFMEYDFTIKDLEGKPVSFSQYKGKVVFLNLWATWCGPCKAEMPGIQRLKERLKDQNVEFVMLSVDKDAALPKVRSYIMDNQYTFPVFMPNGYLPEMLLVPSIPTTFVISKEGKILMKEVGTRNYNTDKMANFLLAQSSK